MIKVITKEEIVNNTCNSTSTSNSIKKVSSPDPDCPYLIDKKVYTIFISGGKIGIPNSEQIQSIKIKEKSFPISVLPSDNEFKYFLSLIVLEDDLDDIEIDYKDLSEERQKKLNQIL